MYMKREEVIRLFPERIRKILQQAYWNPQGLQEIRLRAGKPLILWQDGQEYFVAEQGFLTRHREQACIVSQEDIRRTMETVGTYSLYAYEEELKQGFLTIQGGHRVGVAGKAIMEEQKVKGLSQISCINIYTSISISKFLFHLIHFLLYIKTSYAVQIHICHAQQEKQSSALPDNRR